MPAAALRGIDAKTLKRQQRPVAGTDSKLELGAADLDADKRRFTPYRSASSRAVQDGLLGGETAEEVVDDPVEDDLVQRFDDSHVVDGGVELWWASVFSLPPENPVMPMVVRPCSLAQRDGFEDIGAVSRSRYGEQRRRRATRGF